MTADEVMMMESENNKYRNTFNVEVAESQFVTSHWPPMTRSMACSKCLALTDGPRCLAAINAASLQTLAMSAPDSFTAKNTSSTNVQTSLINTKHINPTYKHVSSLKRSILVPADFLLLFN